MIPSVNIELIGLTTLHIWNTVVFHVTCYHINLLEKEVWAAQGKDGWARCEEPQRTKAQCMKKKKKKKKKSEGL
jgi:hypothetical protein